MKLIFQDLLKISNHQALSLSIYKLKIPKINHNNNIEKSQIISNNLKTNRKNPKISKMIQYTHIKINHPNLKDKKTDYLYLMPWTAFKKMMHFTKPNRI